MHTSSDTGEQDPTSDDDVLASLQALEAATSKAREVLAGLKAETRRRSRAEMPFAKYETARRGYAGRKKRTNVSIDSALTEIAKRAFPNTRYGSLSGFIDAMLMREFKANAPRLRRAGISLPAWLFETSK